MQLGVASQRHACEQRCAPAATNSSGMRRSGLRASVQSKSPASAWLMSCAVRIGLSSSLVRLVCAYATKPFRLLVLRVLRRRGEPSTIQSRSLAWWSGRRAFLRECGPFLRARIRQPASKATCLHAHLRERALKFAFPALWALLCTVWMQAESGTPADRALLIAELLRREHTKEAVALQFLTIAEVPRVQLGFCARVRYS